MLLRIPICRGEVLLGVHYFNSITYATNALPASLSITRTKILSRTVQWVLGKLLSRRGRGRPTFAAIVAQRRFISPHFRQASKKALTLEDEKQCGRPLGVRWRPGELLYVMDAYHGVFVLDMKNGGRAKHLVRCFCALL